MGLILTRASEVSQHSPARSFWLNWYHLQYSTVHAVLYRYITLGTKKAKLISFACTVQTARFTLFLFCFAPGRDGGEFSTVVVSIFT
jgi:hypothetical protein